MTIRRRKRKNPITKDDITFDFKPISNSSVHVIINYRGTPIYEDVMSKAKAALLRTSKGKDTIAAVIKNNLSKRKNPATDKTKEKEEEKHMLVRTSVGEIGLPPTLLESYRLGYRKGLEDGLNKCGITQYFERQKLREKLNEELRMALQHFHEQQENYGKLAGVKLPKNKA